MDMKESVLFALKAIQPATRGEICGYLMLQDELEKKSVSRTIAKLRKSGDVVGDENVPPRYMLIDKDNKVETKDLVEHQDKVPGHKPESRDLKIKVLRRLEVIMADDIAEVLRSIRKDIGG